MIRATDRSSFCPGSFVMLLVLFAVLTRGLPAHAADKSVRKQGSQQKAEPNPTDDLPEGFPYQNRIPCPELTGGVGWLNTAGPLELKDLRGKFVVLDFWTFCCINCMHILPELKKLEAAYPREMVVIGVHSAKFEKEEDTKNIAEAIQRYDIEHPVINDARHGIWNRFGINSWPTVLVIDPEGNLVWGRNGEVEFKLLDQVIKTGLAYYRRKGVLDETPLRFDLEAYKARSTPLRYPGKILADAGGDRLFIADSNHNRIVVTDLDGKLIAVIGSGALGSDDGSFATAKFNHPQGMALAGDSLYIADTENQLLRKVDMKHETVTTIAGTGQQRRSYLWPGMPDSSEKAVKPARPGLRFAARPAGTALNSPWDLCVHDGDLYLAMAGSHQIWRMSLDEKEIGPYAGNGREDIVDGLLLPPQPYEEAENVPDEKKRRPYSSFAQPSGLTTDGMWLYVADSEGSSIRAVPFKATQEVRTVIGTSQLPHARLFTFGDVDGKGDKVRLQHCLGVAWLDGKLYVADTYNNKIKVIDPKAKTCTALVGTGLPGTADDPAQFDEPAGVSAAGGRLYVADTNNHLIRVIDLKHGNRVSTLSIEGLEPPQPADEAVAAKSPEGKTIDVAPASLKPDEGKVHIAMRLNLPDGYKINAEAPTAYRLEATSKQGVVDRQAVGKTVKLDKPVSEFQIDLPLATETGSDELKLSLTYYYCQEGSAGLCKIGSATWKLPLKLAAGADTSTIALELDVN